MLKAGRCDWRRLPLDCAGVAEAYLAALRAFLRRHGGRRRAVLQQRSRLKEDAIIGLIFLLLRDRAVYGVAGDDVVNIQTIISAIFWPLPGGCLSAAIGFVSMAILPLQVERPDGDLLR